VLKSVHIGASVWYHHTLNACSCNTFACHSSSDWR